MSEQSWSSAMAALDAARRRERASEFSIASRLETIRCEILEREAFYRHLTELTHDMNPGNSYAAGLRDA